MNVHDSEKIAGIFSESGYEQSGNAADADVIVINTCSVRQKAEQKFFSDLGRLKPLKQIKPDLKIAVAGCIAEQSGNDIFKRFPYVDFIFGPQNIDSLQKWINGRTQNPEHRTQTTTFGDNPVTADKIMSVKREGQVRALVSIMHGCDNFCSYCVVPYTRGREKSRTSKEIYSEVQVIAKQGFKEITLLGQNVNSYGRNLLEKIDFPDLLKVIHDIPGIERIRFVTSHPRDMSEKLIDCMRELPKVCEHIHLPIQSGSDRILDIMNRGYTYNEYKEKIDKLRQAIPDIAITTDIIAGFPGETEEDFNRTITTLTEIEFDGIFAFKYSKRPDTKALSLPDHLDEDTKTRRLAKVLTLQESITFNKNKKLEGEVVQVLVEGVSETDKNKLTGRTRTNKIVHMHGDMKLTGNLIHVKILEAKQHSLNGEIIHISDLN
jgi:tRNA-2-methylthio-N6-dimethylallyladenosine synthase